MAEIKMKNLIVEIGDKKYKMIGYRLEDICEELGISEDRFIELLSRDAYCPTLSAAPTSSTLTYVDTDGSTNHFHVGQLCRWAEGSDYRLAVCKNATQTSVAWHILPTKVSELTNDAGYLTQHQDISGKLDKTTAASTYLSKTDASNTYLGKTAKAASAASADSATKATQDASGNVITSTYATKTDLSSYKNEINSDVAEIRAIADESLETSEEAERVSYNAVNTATQAESKAETAKNAVATLSGLSNTTTAQQTLAAQVTQIEANKQNLLLVPSFELYKETNYEL